MSMSSTAARAGSTSWASESDTGVSSRCDRISTPTAMTTRWRGRHNAPTYRVAHRPPGSTMATGPANDHSRGVESPLDSMREHVEVTAAFQQWLHENGHTDGA